MRLLVLLLLLLGCARSAHSQRLFAENRTVGLAAALHYALPVTQSVESTAIEEGGVGVTTGNSTQALYYASVWELGTDEDDDPVYARVSPNGLSWFVSCFLFACGEDLETVEPDGRVRDSGWTYVRGFLIPETDLGYVLFDAGPSAFGLGVNLAAPYLEGKGEKDGDFLIPEIGPQVSHVLTLNTDGTFPIYALTTVSYAWGYDVSGGGAARGLKVSSDVAVLTGVTFLGRELGIGASYFYDNRTMKGDLAEVDASFSGFTLGLTWGGG